MLVPLNECKPGCAAACFNRFRGTALSGPNGGGLSKEQTLQRLTEYRHMTTDIVRRAAQLALFAQENQDGRVGP